MAEGVGQSAGAQTFVEAALEGGGDARGVPLLEAAKNQLADLHPDSRNRRSGGGG